MRKWSRDLVGLLAAAVFAAFALTAGAETCTLEIKKVLVPSRVPMSSSDKLLQRVFAQTYPQSFFQQLGGPEGMIRGNEDTDKPAFSEVIEKEPKYNTKTPFRGVARLGSQFYGFALDTAAPPEAENRAEDAPAEEDEAEAEGSILGVLAGSLGQGGDRPAPKEGDVEPLAFETLYFDLNHNGDLTDDEPIEAEEGGYRSASPDYAYCQSTFPPVELTIDVDGTKVAYAFRFSIYTNSQREFSFGNASLSAAAYRDGEITLDGEKRRVVVVDFNSNGRFGDVFEVNQQPGTADGQVTPSWGDMLYIDPQPKQGYTSPYDSTANDDQYQFAKLILLDGRYHDVSITPAGDRLTIEPSTTKVGYVTNPNEGYRALVYSDKAILEIEGDESGRAALPVGKWMLLSYTIDQSNRPEPAKEEDSSEEDEERVASLLDVLAQSVARSAASAVSPRRPVVTKVSARGTMAYDPVEVVEGKTVEMPFGPPYRPEVSAQYPQGDRTVSLGLTITGSAGEVCSNLVVDGGRPEAPTFKITTEDGAEVSSGVFEYG